MCFRNGSIHKSYLHGHHVERVRRAGECHGRKPRHLSAFHFDKLHQAEKGEAGYVENDNDGLASHTFVKPIGGSRGLVNMQLAGRRIDCISAGD